MVRRDIDILREQLDSILRAVRYLRRATSAPIPGAAEEVYDAIHAVVSDAEARIVSAAAIARKVSR